MLKDIPIQIVLFLVLPCVEQPPKAPSGGQRWYDIEFVRYACPSGKKFQHGSFPYLYSNCTVEKQWEPPSVEKCIGMGN